MTPEHEPARKGQGSATAERKFTGTVAEAADILGVGRNHAYDLAKRGEIPTKRFGGRVVVLWQPLMRMLNGQDAIQ